MPAWRRVDTLQQIGGESLDGLLRKRHARDHGSERRTVDRVLGCHEALERGAPTPRIGGVEIGWGDGRAHAGRPLTIVSAMTRSGPTPSM
jgi:hypothetical protein